MGFMCWWVRVLLLCRLPERCKPHREFYGSFGWQLWGTVFRWIDPKPRPVVKAGFLPTSHLESWLCCSFSLTFYSIWSCYHLTKKMALNKPQTELSIWAILMQRASFLEWLWEKKVPGRTATRLGRPGDHLWPFVQLGMG